jgi:riboflavin kinase/FMN adenylyltransferase
MKGFFDRMDVVDFFSLKAHKYSDSCITIGNFDGVHLGHQAIIRQMLADVCAQNRPVLVVTFFPNPAVFFNQTVPHFYLTSPEEKKSYLMGLGVDEVLTFEFDRAFADLTPAAFLRALKEKLGLSELVVGRDFALGRNRQGTLPVIEAIGRELGFSVNIVSPVKVDGEVISSTMIRNMLENGNVSGAAAKLGRRYRLEGKVVHGSDRGARIGLPTANLAHWPLKRLPAVGVYAVYASVHGKQYPAITNVGLRPTFETQEIPNVETHILDFDGNIYGEVMTLAFVEKIRDEKKFSGVDAFMMQIERDKETARRIFRDG